MAFMFENLDVYRKAADFAHEITSVTAGLQPERIGTQPIGAIEGNPAFHKSADKCHVTAKPI